MAAHIAGQAAACDAHGDGVVAWLHTCGIAQLQLQHSAHCMLQRMRGVAPAGAAPSSAPLDLKVQEHAWYGSSSSSSAALQVLFGDAAAGVSGGDWCSLCERILQQLSFGAYAQASLFDEEEKVDVRLVHHTHSAVPDRFPQLHVFVAQHLLLCTGGTCCGFCTRDDDRQQADCCSSFV